MTDNDNDNKNANDGIKSPSSASSDFYGLLGIPRTATTDDVKRKYKQLAQKLHPDKISKNIDQGEGEENRNYMREVAARSFGKIHEAYDVLIDEEKRKIYDVYGSEGVRSGLEVSMNKRKTVEEMRREYEYAQRQIARERADAVYQQSGAYEFKFSGAHFVDKRLRATRRLNKGGRSIVEMLERVSGMTDERLAKQLIQKALGDFHVEDIGLDFQSGNVSASVNCAISEETDVYLQAQFAANADGRGAGVLLVGVRKQLGLLTSIDWHLQMPSSSSSAMELTLDQKLSNRTSGTMTYSYGQDQLGLRLGLKRQLTQTHVGNLDWTVGPMPGISTGCRGKAGENGVWKFDLNAGVQNMGVTGSYQRKVINDEHKNKIKKYSFKLGTMGIEFENGTMAALSDGESSVGWGVCIGVEGCVLKIKYRQRNQQFVFPILLAPGLPYLTGRTAMLCLTIPNALIGVLRNVLIIPLLKRKKRVEKKQMRLRYASEIDDNRKDAKAQQKLVFASAREKRLHEREIGGLDIVKAVYGSFEDVSCDVTKKNMTFPDDLNRDKNKNNKNENEEIDAWIDVTVALQHMVEYSALELHENVSYSALLGFCDCDPLDKKFLKIRYRYRRALHEVCIAQDSQLHLPYDGHRIAETFQTLDDDEPDINDVVQGEDDNENKKEEDVVQEDM
jgi:DnaJ homolog subfamily C member 11